MALRGFSSAARSPPLVHSAFSSAFSSAAKEASRGPRFWLPLLRSAKSAAKVRKLLEDIRDAGHGPDAHHLSAAMRTATKRGRPETALDIFRDAASKYGVVPDLVLYNVALQANAAKADWQAAAALLLGPMEDAPGLAPTVASFNAVLGACARAGEHEVAVELLRVMEEESRGLTPDAVSFDCAIEACAGAAEWDKVLDLYQWQIARRGLTPRTSWPRVIRAHAELGQWERALELLREPEVRAAGLEGDVEGMYSAIIGAVPSHMLELARELFVEATAKGLYKVWGKKRGVVRLDLRFLPPAVARVVMHHTMCEFEEVSLALPTPASIHCSAMLARHPTVPHPRH